ncbi:protease inhibitor Inh/omp19 family protein [Aquamicrobium zhengzhouense]|uniref:Protease inhibitor Inh/omp19 family protein n=1 Tax=Aquamicrobium zhengzhouense TaxID=2781738 RepID=A0ABS0SI28_9HYPH|nr:protease inhibitor Inh/omp19 family protein [Aquamicrobium zhengzhouense]MBI1622127.1 protease inhibitor Inh/omp19 family protein [Aquamicrobium zhengzhouense]
MILRTSGVVLTSLLALSLAGCQSERFSPYGARSNAPAPLVAAPSGQVTSGQLPPPAQPGMSDPSQFPAAPGADTAPTQNTQVAALEQGAADISTGSVAGVWNASVAGQSCRIATPQTRFGQGYRAGPLRCPAPLDGVKSWNVEGKQLALYDANGSVLARLYSSGGSRFDGQTTSGQAVSLSR